MKHTGISLLALLVAAPLPLLAQDDQATVLEEIVVSANISPTDAASVGSSVSIVTDRDLATAGPGNLGTALSRLPSISVTETGGLGSTSSLRLRGLNAAYLKVLIDGIDVSDPASTQSQFDFGTLGTAGISRVEVLRGSQSAQYGSAAVAGVISITSNQAVEYGNVSSIALEAGSYDTQSASYNFSSLGDRHELSFTATRTHSGGFSAGDEDAGNTENDGYTSTRVSFSGSYDVTDLLTLGASGFVAHGTTDTDECCDADVNYFDGITPGDDTSDLDTQGVRVFATLNGERLTQTFALSRFENDRVIDGTDTNFYGVEPADYKYSYSGTRTVLDYRGSYKLSDMVTLGFGAAHTRETLNSVSDDQFNPPSGAINDVGSRTLDGIFGEATFAVNPSLDLTISARHDDYSTFGGHDTLRIAAAYRATESVLLRFSAGSGFVAPSLYQLYSAQYGNPDLEPETSRSVDFGVEKIFGNGALVKGTLFYQEIDDLIEFVTLTSYPDPYTGEYQTSSGTSRSSGIELEGSVPLSDRLTLNGMLTYTHTKDPEGETLSRVPRTDLRVGLEAKVTDRLDAAISVHAVSGFNDERSGELIPMPDYQLVDASLQYDLGNDAQVYLRAENLLNTNYQVLEGYGTSDRAFYVGLRKSF